MTRIDEILTPQQAAVLVQLCADALIREDGLDADTALRLACERAADGDPLLLAAPGQVWQLREDVDIDDAPARRLRIYGRASCPPRVLAGDADDVADVDELPVGALDLYELVDWTAFMPEVVS